MLCPDKTCMHWTSLLTAAYANVAVNMASCITFYNNTWYTCELWKYVFEVQVSQQITLVSHQRKSILTFVCHGHKNPIFSTSEITENDRSPIQFVSRKLKYKCRTTKVGPRVPRGPNSCDPWELWAPDMCLLCLYYSPLLLILTWFLQVLFCFNVNKFYMHSSPRASNVCTHYTVKLGKQHRQYVIVYRHGWTEAIGAPDRWGCGSMVTVLCAWSWLISSYISSTVNGFRFYTTLTARSRYRQFCSKQLQNSTKDSCSARPIAITHSKKF